MKEEYYNILLTNISVGEKQINMSCKEVRLLACMSKCLWANYSDLTTLFRLGLDIKIPIYESRFIETHEGIIM